mgnify:CR=1 FL=1
MCRKIFRKRYGEDPGRNKSVENTFKISCVKDFLHHQSIKSGGGIDANFIPPGYVNYNLNRGFVKLYVCSMTFGKIKKPELTFCLPELAPLFNGRLHSIYRTGGHIVDPGVG